MKKEGFGLETKATKYVAIAAPSFKANFGLNSSQMGFITDGKREMPKLARTE